MIRTLLYVCHSDKDNYNYRDIYFIICLLSASTDPPTYSLDPDYLQVTAGSSPTMEFTVTSYPPLVDAKHTLSKKVYGGTTTGKRFKVEGNKIVLRNVDVGDSGLYRISCCNDDGEEGEEILELEVRPSDDAPQAVRKTSITSLQSQAQSDKQVTSASTSKRKFTYWGWGV